MARANIPSEPALCLHALGHQIPIFVRQAENPLGRKPVPMRVGTVTQWVPVNIQAQVQRQCFFVAQQNHLRRVVGRGVGVLFLRCKVVFKGPHQVLCQRARWKWHCMLLSKGVVLHETYASLFIGNLATRLFCGYGAGNSSTVPLASI